MRIYVETTRQVSASPLIEEDCVDVAEVLRVIPGGYLAVFECGGKAFVPLEQCLPAQMDLWG